MYKPLSAENSREMVLMGEAYLKGNVLLLVSMSELLSNLLHKQTLNLNKH